MKTLWQYFLICITIILSSKAGVGQNLHKINLSLNAGMNSSGSLKYGETYSSFSSNPEILIESSSPSRTRNFNLGIGFYLTESFMINGSIGAANYGFFYKGDTFLPSGDLANVKINERYNFRGMEVNLSGIYNIDISPDITFMIQPGFSWYTNPNRDFNSTLIIFQNSNNFSATIFTGLEFPVFNDFIFINAGLSAKLPLSNFAAFYDFENTYYPYSIGIQAGISYRFHSN